MYWRSKCVWPWKAKNYIPHSKWGLMKGIQSVKLFLKNLFQESGLPLDKEVAFMAKWWASDWQSKLSDINLSPVSVILSISKFTSSVRSKSFSSGKIVAEIFHFLFRFPMAVQSVLLMILTLSLRWLCQHLFQTVYWTAIIAGCFWVISLSELN